MATLHVLSHSPFTDSRLDSCIRILASQDSVLLTGDAVYALLPDSPTLAKLSAMTTSQAVYALEEDVKARNISIEPPAKCVTYAEFVALTCQYDKVNSWL